MKATIQNIKAIMEEADILGDIEQLNANLSLNEQGVDSLDMANIYLLIEEKFSIKIPDEDIAKVQTLDTIVEYINNKL